MQTESVAWVTGRKDLLAALFTLPFLLIETNSVWGGNLPSTLAGEFAYSLGLTFAVLTVGVVSQGLDTGRHRGRVGEGEYVLHHRPGTV